MIQPIPLQFERQFAAPLKPEEVFATEALMNAYLTNGTRFAGQQCTCLEHESIIYVLSNDRSKWVGNISDAAKLILEAQQVYVGSVQPTNPNVLVWYKTVSAPTTLSDVDILRSIRAANPQSTDLATLFDDSKDPHTDWWSNNNGALFGDNPALLQYGLTLPTVLDPNTCYALVFYNFGIIELNITGLKSLVYLDLPSNKIAKLDITGLSNLTNLNCQFNLLTAESIAIILSEIVSMNLSTLFIDLRGDTNAGFSTWSVQAKADAQTIMSRGCSLQCKV